ncbi:hypothetical protein Dimus_016176 [Dionaea muscipula]
MIRLIRSRLIIFFILICATTMEKREGRVGRCGGAEQAMWVAVEQADGGRPPSWQMVFGRRAGNWPRMPSSRQMAEDTVEQANGWGEQKIRPTDGGEMVKVFDQAWNMKMPRRGDGGGRAGLGEASLSRRWMMMKPSTVMESSSGWRMKMMTIQQS